MHARDFDDLTHPEFGKPLCWWRYGETLAVANLLHPSGRLMGMMAVRDDTGCSWHVPPPPLPLYGAPMLQARRDAPVLVVESEAAAEGAGALFADHICITWPGGCNAVDKADLSLLSGRDVILWPTCDGDGVTTMAQLQARLRGMARTVAQVAMPDAWPEGWDLAQTPPDGVTVETLRTLLEVARSAVLSQEEQGDSQGHKPHPEAAQRPSRRVGNHAGSAITADPIERDCSPSFETPAAPAPQDEVASGPARSLSPAGGRTISADWPEPDVALLDDDGSGDLPAFPVDVLPPFWRAWSGGAAREAGTPIDLVALSLLTAAAGLIGGARRVAPVPSWSEPCVLWTALVGGPACGKTAALETSLRLVRALDRDLADSNAAQRRRHVTAQAVARAEAWWWHEGVRGAVANHRAATEIPAIAQEMESFAPRRLVADDPALGAMLDALRGNPRGVLLVRDPLADWLNDSAGGADRAFWLASWSGHASSVTVKRAPAVRLDCTAVSILGTIRPEAIASTFANDADDVAARLLFAWPQRASFQSLPETMTTTDQAASEALSRLRDLPEEVRVLSLAPDARVAFDRFRRIHHAQAGVLEGCEADWWSRGAGTVLRLAGVLTWLAWSEAMAEPEPTQVPAWAVRAAASLWLDYLWPHARGVFHLAGGSAHERRARRVLRWLQQHGKAEVSRTELRRSALGRTCDAAETGRIAESLVMGGWLRPVATIATGRGRPPVRWAVNDALHEARGA